MGARGAGVTLWAFTKYSWHIGNVTESLLAKQKLRMRSLEQSDNRVVCFVENVMHQRLIYIRYCKRQYGPEVRD